MVSLWSYKILPVKADKFILPTVGVAVGVGVGVAVAVGVGVAVGTGSSGGL